MKKNLLRSMALVAMILAAVGINAKQYCHEPLTKDGNTIYLTAQMPSEGNYELLIEADVALNGMGGSFVRLSDGTHDLRDFMTKLDEKALQFKFSSTSAPNIYTPLYVLMPGEVNFGQLTDIEWGVCEGSGYLPTGNFTAQDNYGCLITFSEVAKTGTLKDSTFEANALKITTLDTEGKQSIDANNAYFGTPKRAFQLAYRLKTGGKSSAKNVLNGVAPEDGTLLIYARSSSSSAKDRNVQVKQAGTTLLDTIVADSMLIQVVKVGKEKYDTVKIYPVFEVELKAGDFTIEYPVGAINFYGFDFKGAPKEEPVVAAPQPTTYPLITNIYSDAFPNQIGMAFGEWGSGSTQSEIQVGDNIYKVVVGIGYFGLDYNQTNGGLLNMSMYDYLHTDIWVAEDITINYYLIDSPASEKFKTVNLVGQTWNSLDFSLAEFEQLGVNLSALQQIKITCANGTVLFFDNIYFYRTTAVEDTTAPTDFTATLDRASYFSLYLRLFANDDNSVVNYYVYNGQELLFQAGVNAGEVYVMNVYNLQSDTEYTLTVLAEDIAGNQTEPATVTARTLATPAPAPTPTVDEADVISIFSNAYAAATWFNVGSWGQTTQATIGNIGGNDVVYYMTNSNYMGWELNGNQPAFDATGYTGVHMDIYPVVGVSIQFTPIWGVGGEALVTKPLVAGQWNQLNFLFSEYPGIDLAKIYQLKWAEMPQEMFLDNVYIYKDLNNAVENIDAEQTNLKKVVENGVIYIIRDGAKYNLLGVQVK